jgi:diguanylate cyclase (GGDEF)-like protein
MRGITGWRFLVYIAVPLVLASLGAINLSYDLLTRVESGSNYAEHQRNNAVLLETTTALEADLARLVSENAAWEQAVRISSGTPDAALFDSTWGKSFSMGVSYDTVALLDAQSGAVLLGNTLGNTPVTTESLLGKYSFAAFRDMLDLRNQGHGIVSGFIDTPSGPVALAMAPIYAANTKPEGTGRILYMSRSLKSDWLGGVQRKLLMGGLGIIPGQDQQGPHIKLKSPDGQVAFSLLWKDRLLGEILTESSWTKASAVLGFLILVMTGIGYVCWKLVQQLVEDESKAQHNALHDHLTGLPNRHFLMKNMQQLQDENKTYALAFADLDGFKEVNDSYGHEFGDRLIFMIANGICQLADRAALCSRLGGDEFVVLFSGANAGEDARTFAVHLIAMLKQPFDMEGRLASVGASIGIAERQNDHDVTEMLRRSDIAMYKAKGSGKNRYCVFDESFDLERNENLSIASELKSILAARNLDIVFQPVVNARTSEITGVEALARWPSTSHRKVGADKFVGIAEKSGLIDSLGELILEKACVAAANWPDIRLAVNISAVQLNNPAFVSTSLAVLHKYGIQPNRVEFEITETSLIHDTERAKLVFKALQQAGIKVALDDFGTGFSSIGYLRTFQFDRIKIDKSIVDKVLSSASELAVVQGTLLVARGLSAEVTAEGIENADEAAVLRLAGCTEFQGYLYHKPLTESEFTETLRRTRVAHVPRSIVA